TDYAPDQGIQAEFFDTRLRYYDSDNKLVLQKMDVIDIFSISAMNRFFMPVSWKVSTGVKRIPDKKGDHGYAAFLNTGAGLAFHDNKLGLGYLFIEPEINIGDSLYDKYAIGLGVSAGWLKKLSPLWKAHFFARKLWFEPEDGHTRSEISLAQEIILEKNHHINFTVSWKEFYGHGRGEGMLAWHIYF
ncbi:hypothetical protein QUF76_19280, partial [Desulfobacterales bacterium HSG16]|nr:hypothetical protein [Desulfobacterales bacterium HSG16]